MDDRNFIDEQPAVQLPPISKVIEMCRDLTKTNPVGNDGSTCFKIGNEANEVSN